MKVKDGRNVPEKSDCLGSKKITSRVDRRVVTAEKEIPSPQQPNRLNRSSNSPMKNRDSKNDGDFTGKGRSEICLKGDPSWTKARGTGRRGSGAAAASLRRRRKERIREKRKKSVFVQACMLQFLIWTSAFH